MRTSGFVGGIALVGGALLLAATDVRAQGSVSTQGYGYPPGHLGTRAQGSAGAIAEFDEESPVNPSAVIGWNNPGVHVQYDPEFRRVRLASGPRVPNTTISRFPVVIAAIPVSSRGAVGISIATMLDRTFLTTSTNPRFIGAESLFVTERFRAAGGMNDVRLGGAYRVGRFVTVGVAGHAITGESRLTQVAAFNRERPGGGAIASDSGFVTYGQDVTFGFSGVALSAGAQIQPAKNIGVALSGRYGGNIRTTRRGERGDSVLTRAGVPHRWGMGVRFQGIAGTVLAAGVQWDGWSALQSLGVDAVARDAWSYSFGAETGGPRVLGAVVALRGGVRLRTLPYEALGEQVRERAITGGLGIPVAFNRAQLGVSVQHAARSAGDARETGWTLGFGLTIRP